MRGSDGIIPPILYLSRGTGRRHLSHPHVRMAASDLPGATRPHRRRCDETENPGRSQYPGPLALLPVARSPSRPCHHDRWWALTPPVRPLPARLAALAGILSVAVVVRTRLSPACPRLLFRGATLSRSQPGAAECPGCRTGSREVPLGSSQPWLALCPATAHPSIHPDYTTRREPHQIAGARGM